MEKISWFIKIHEGVGSLPVMRLFRKNVEKKTEEGRKKKKGQILNKPGKNSKLIWEIRYKLYGLIRLIISSTELPSKYANVTAHSWCIYIYK